MNTAQKIKFLRKKAKSEFRRIKKKDPENIIGFRIGKKIINGKESRNYSIIFHVVKKIEPSQLEIKNTIPSTLKISFPSKEKKFIQTDVEETGKFHLQSGIAGIVKSKESTPSNFGSAGFFVTDDDTRVLFVTNYHVVAENFMADGRNYYQRNPDDLRLNVSLRTTQGNLVRGCLEEGRIANDIDVAFVLQPGVLIRPGMNSLDNNKQVQGVIRNEPIPNSFRGMLVRIFSVSRPLGISSKINNVEVSTGEGGSEYVDLIQLRKVTIGGDSGSIVLTQDYLILGIIIGADNIYSYAIPFYKIINFKNFRIL